MEASTATSISAGEADKSRGPDVRSSPKTRRARNSAAPPSHELASCARVTGNLVPEETMARTTTLRARERAIFASASRIAQRNATSSARRDGYSATRVSVTETQAGATGVLDGVIVTPRIEDEDDRVGGGDEVIVATAVSVALAVALAAEDVEAELDDVAEWDAVGEWEAVLEGVADWVAKGVVVGYDARGEKDAEADMDVLAVVMAVSVDVLLAVEVACPVPEELVVALVVTVAIPVPVLLAVVLAVAVGEVVPVVVVVIDADAVRLATAFVAEPLAVGVGDEALLGVPLADTVHDPVADALDVGVGEGQEILRIRAPHSNT